MTDNKQLTERPCETPLIERARDVPISLRAKWPIQWSPGGTETGHAMCPIGKLVHDLADALEAAERHLNIERDTIIAMRSHIEELEAEIKRLYKACDERERGTYYWMDKCERLRAVVDFAAQQPCVAFDHECIHCYALAAVQEGDDG